ncbi:Crp/Fnr family transcriptional regulator [Listeria grandensis]|uniref:Crp/Fnr family transcriptional regulator n=1 Tax=Listeria grandensis TaxID=1494963 RepID=UPI00162778B1|nr:Crp/Fnr family transcriptional regulator [Listeria grandensis]MBC1474310.1 Crp/Fnr family transcriptional regulator [Listeria grandensis]
MNSSITLNEAIQQQKRINSLLKQYLVAGGAYSIPSEICFMEADQVIIAEDTLLTDIYMIASGVAVVMQDGIIIQFLGRNECLGVENILVGGETRTRIVALTKMKLYKMTLQDVHIKLHKRAQGWRLAAAVMAGRTELLTHHLIRSGVARDRVLDVLLQLSFLYGEEKDHCIYTEKYFSKKMIANYLNVSYVTVVKAFKLLVAEGIIHDEPHGMIVYLNQLSPKIGACS